MPRVVPSQIVEFIDAEFPFARLGQQYNVDLQYKDRVTALVRLVEELPAGFLVMDGAKYNSLVLSISTMKSTLNSNPGFFLVTYPNFMINDWM